MNKDDLKLKQIYGESDDKIELISNVSVPITRNAVYGLFGQKSSGKTTLQNRIVKEIVDRNKKLNSYDLNNPFIVKDAPITNVFLLSKSANSDMSTFLNGETKLKTIIDLRVYQNGMDDFIQQLYSFSDSIIAGLKLQCQLRFNMKQKLIQEKLILYNQQRRRRIEDTEIDLLFQVSQQINILKNKYRYLCVKETNSEIIKNMNLLYQLYQQKYDGLCLRKHSIIIQIDDTSASKFLSGVGQTNLFTEFLTLTRHFGVYAMLINCHSITLFQGQRRQMINNFVLLQGLKLEQVENLFDDLGLVNRNFSKQKFIEEYQNNMGFNAPLEQNGKYKYNFVYILLLPQKQIYLNFDKKIY
ncbi:Conserved_hypothetical protein [Hexamita inflata]|uniref:Uncharacterized protein n=1 Tax=Hexamita inflata TaxID=28002 RepID=A0AA86U4K9_9EUKA|nr:Conserved hypothetical protein [Hexamita inflata]